MKKTITLEGLEAIEISTQPRTDSAPNLCSIAARAHMAADALMSDEPLRQALDQELEVMLSSAERAGEQGRDAALLQRQRDDWEIVRTLALNAARTRDVDGARSARDAAEALAFAYSGLGSALGV
ncbi:hypothetical protein BURKHO8Y_240228 [Burkholderia sp. 8Y]|uniref:hypothetical protein n=1 Tax=Burkholderia sp. 8Y TaxID=2653133 RepID=UPI0012F17B28|nr:hypothetical protein [Burkholderia sp. 8Y]VXC60070.1 hypothetical protein BURKHO8Y_240228 [Burkholderia sp. 8Y]